MEMNPHYLITRTPHGLEIKIPIKWIEQEGLEERDVIWRGSVFSSSSSAINQPSLRGSAHREKS